jgi:DNA-binding NtrC family response regulator
MRKRVLVVEDLRDWRETFSGWLDEHDIANDTASDYETALSLVQANRYDVYVLDLRLEDEDLTDYQGVELLRLIRQMQPTAPVIVATGYPTPEIEREAREVHHVLAFLAKEEHIDHDTFMSYINKGLAPEI